MSLIKMYTNKIFTGLGSRVIRKFVYEFDKHFTRRVERFTNWRNYDNENEHLFYYGEQQTKGHVAAALDSICRSHFLQEPPIERRYGNGRADYWCRYGDTTKIDILMEVKHGWARYWGGDKTTIYSGTESRHRAAVKQLRDTKKGDFVSSGPLFAAALTVMPLFARYKSESDSPINLTNQAAKDIQMCVAKQCGAHFVTTWKMPRKVHSVNSLADSKNRMIHESYPGLLLLWSISKINRDR